MIIHAHHVFGTLPPSVDRLIVGVGVDGDSSV